jgi:flavin-dependent dehydrogenase
MILTRFRDEEERMEILEYKRELPVEGGFDVIVVGGGPSGVAAAIAAGRLGLKVALIERTGCLGGLGTSGLVNVFMPFADDERTLMRGIGLEFVQALHGRGFLPSSVSPDVWHRGHRQAIPFNGEGLKLLMDEFVEGAGVEIRFFTSLIDVLTKGSEIRSIVLSSNNTGRCAVRGGRRTGEHAGPHALLHGLQH